METSFEVTYLPFYGSSSQPNNCQSQSPHFMDKFRKVQLPVEYLPFYCSSPNLIWCPLYGYFQQELKRSYAYGLHSLFDKPSTTNHTIDSSLCLYSLKSVVMNRKYTMFPQHDQFDLSIFRMAPFLCKFYYVFYNTHLC